MGASLIHHFVQFEKTPVSIVVYYEVGIIKENLSRILKLVW